MLAKYNINDIVSYIVIKDESMALMSEMIDSDMTNLKLQKLLYYTQGCFLAKFDQPLFEDKIINWKHGPVVPSIYQRFKICESNSIINEFYRTRDESKEDSISPEDSLFLDKILDKYNQYSPWTLRNMTHSEKPWLETNNGEEITHDKMMSFFKKKKLAI